jgi:Fic family protein
MNKEIEEKFNKRLDNLSKNIWQKIAKIDNFSGQWTAGVKLSPQILMSLKKSVLISSTGSSTRIEGSKLSDEEIEKLMKGISIQNFSNRDKQEVRGYYELLENVFNSYDNIQFNENTIKHFHKELLKYAEKDKEHRGEYKKRENKVMVINQKGESLGILFDTTPAYLTPKEMLELIEWTKESLEKKEFHPLLIISNFLVEFLKIHPFEDGNGRLSRIITNLLLLKNDYSYIPYISHEKIIEDNKPEYYIALRNSQKTNNKNISFWIDFFLNVLLKQSKMAIELLSSEKLEKILTQKQLNVFNYLKEFKQALPSEISKKTKIALPTVRQSLKKLLNLKKIERIGRGRSTMYRFLE